MLWLVVNFTYRGLDKDEVPIAEISERSTCAFTIVKCIVKKWKKSEISQIHNIILDLKHLLRDHTWSCALLFTIC